MKEQKQEYDLPENWTLATIEELIDGESGIFKDGDWIESKDQDANGDVRLIQLADIGDGFFRNRSDRFMTKENALKLNCTFLKKGDILVARMPDPLGRACIFPYSEEEKYVTVVDVAIIRTGQNGVDNRYLTYFINSPAIRMQIGDLQTGTTRKRISRGNLASIKIPIPPLNEQIRIALKIDEIFSEVDNGVTNLKHMQNQLKSYRQVLLKNAFAGKLTEKWREENKSESAKKLLTRINAERYKKYEEELHDWSISLQNLAKEEKRIKKPQKPSVYNSISNEEIFSLPNKPNGWAYCRVNEIAELVSGFAFKSNKFVNKGFYSVIRIGNLYNNNFDLTRNPVFLPKDTSDELIKKYSVNEENILISLTGTKYKRDYGNAVSIPKGKKNLLINQRILSVKPLIDKLFLLYLLRENIFLNQFFSFETGGANQGNVSAVAVGNIVLLMPPLEEQQKISQEIEYQFSIIENLQRTIEFSLKKSESLKKSILKQAFEGKLVKQDSNDALASELLKRNKTEKKKILDNQKLEKKLTSKKIKKMNKELSIEDVLMTSDKPMLSKDVWQQSKHKNNIEAFYKELKDIQDKIKEVKKDNQSLLSLVK